MHKICFLFLGCFLFCSVCAGQSFYRIAADFSVKQKTASGQKALTIGRVYFDRSVGKVVFANTFPKKEHVVMTDSAIYFYENSALVKKTQTYAPVSFTIFNLSLTGALANYGLENSYYKIEKVEKEKDMVVTTWIPTGKYAKYMGRILLSTKNKKLYGIAIFNKENQLLSKQFYKNYLNVNGLDFPAEIVEITYFKEGKEAYQVTTYKNIVVDELQNTPAYNYTLR